MAARRCCRCLISAPTRAALLLTENLEALELAIFCCITHRLRTEVALFTEVFEAFKLAIFCRGT